MPSNLLGQSAAGSTRSGRLCRCEGSREVGGEVTLSRQQCDCYVEAGCREGLEVGQFRSALDLEQFGRRDGGGQLRDRLRDIQGDLLPLLDGGAELVAGFGGGLRGRGGGGSRGGRGVLGVRGGGGLDRGGSGGHGGAPCWSIFRWL